MVLNIFQKFLQEGCLSEITHVVTSTSEIMMSLFDLVCQFASDACAKAHTIDFLYMLFLTFESLKYDSNALAFVTRRVFG